MPLLIAGLLLVTGCFGPTRTRIEMVAVRLAAAFAFGLAAIAIVGSTALLALGLAAALWLPQPRVGLALV